MKNWYLALLSGGLLALAWPTYGFSFFIFFAFVPLLLLEEKIRNSETKTKRKIFFFSYLSFLIWNTVTTWWIWYATPFGSLFAILVNSFLMTITFLLYHIIAKRTTQTKSIIFLIFSWISFEKLHLEWDFSWPWLNLGNVFSENILWIQWYEYTGIFGGTLWILLVNTVIFISIKNYLQQKNKSVFIRNLGKISLLISLPIIISMLLYTFYQNKGKATEVLVIQPNIDPYSEKYDTSNSDIAFLLTDLASEKVSKQTEFILAPETVFASNTDIAKLGNSHAINILKYFTQRYPSVNFLSGISLFNFISDPKKVTPQSNPIGENLWFHDYNSAFLLNNQEDLQLYHKSKLVVGVENLPFAEILKPIMSKVMIDLGGTVAMKTTQKNRNVFVSNQQKKVAPIICYESVYGEFIGKYSQNNAQFLGVITNDSWWRNTQGHKQLLSYTKLRAIENRKDIARSANTGISAFINQKGEVTQQLPYQTQGVLKGVVWANNQQTFYSKYGDYIARIAIFISFGIFLLTLFSKKIKNN